MLRWLVCFTGYNSTEAFNDRRLVDLARLVPFGPSSTQNVSQEDSSLPVLNTALCLPDTPTTTDDGASVADEAAADKESMLVDLTLGVSVPVTLAAGLTLTTETVTEAEPVLPKLETPVDRLHGIPPSGVTPEALHALETLLGIVSFIFGFVAFVHDHSYIGFLGR